jgi:hypothetical protein
MHRLRLGPHVQMPSSERAPGEVPIQGFTAHLQNGTLQNGTLRRLWKTPRMPSQGEMPCHAHPALLPDP